MFTHHRLKVYEKALSLAGRVQELSASWGKRHAIVEHFRRASESIVFNIAEGARLQRGPDKAKTLDYSIGSSLECAACLDIASIQGYLTEARLLAEKRRYLEVTRMLVGLRKAWLQTVLKEEPIQRIAEMPAAGTTFLFHHESLDVYQTGLDFIRWFMGLPGWKGLSERLCREIDRSGTSVVLNITEGNGRYSELDHRRFLDIAAGSAVKTAVYLDLYQQMSQVDTAKGRELLSRIIAMVNRF